MTLAIHHQGFSKPKSRTDIIAKINRDRRTLHSAPQGVDLEELRYNISELMEEHGIAESELCQLPAPAG